MIKKSLLVLMLCGAFTTIQPAQAHPGEATYTWYPSSCWAGGEVWHYTAGSSALDYNNNHWFRELWTGNYYFVSDHVLQKAYQGQGAECGRAQFVTSNEVDYFTSQMLPYSHQDYTGQYEGWRVFLTKCAVFARRFSNPYRGYRIARGPQPAGCSMAPGEIMVVNP